MEPTRALIAEDEALVADVVEDELQKIGIQVVGRASDGRQAVDLTESLAPDVVVMDMQMPEMDGIEASRRIQERRPTPVVALTVYSEPELVARAAAAGVGAYVIKPPEARELARAITIARARFADLAELRLKNGELRELLAKTKTLTGLLPICSGCKKIRDEQGRWRDVESYLREHTSAEFSHSLCPACMEKEYPRELYPFLYDDELHEDEPSC
jgi:AmiR/NasT family two-component response regulator